MRQLVSVVVDNRFGEIPRIVGICSGRGYPIDAVTAADTADGRAMRITILTRCDERAAERLRKLLASQVRVLEAVTLPADSIVEREVALVTVHAGRTAVHEWLRPSPGLRLHVVAVSDEAVTLEVVGDADGITAFAESLATAGPCDVARSGTLALVPSAATSRDPVPATTPPHGEI